MGLNNYSGLPLLTVATRAFSGSPLGRFWGLDRSGPFGALRILQERMGPVVCKELREIDVPPQALICERSIRICAEAD